MRIQPITWRQALPIRHRVLWPNKPLEFTKIDGDEEANHYGVFMDEKLVCVASIYIKATEARLRKFATLPEHQNEGVGSSMIQFILSDLELSNIEHLWFDARETATGFYKKFGFSIVSEKFYKSGIAYYKMSIRLGS